MNGTGFPEWALERFQEKWTRFSVRKRDQTGNLEHFHESINLGNALEAIANLVGPEAFQFDQGGVDIFEIFGTNAADFFH